MNPGEGQRVEPPIRGRLAPSPTGVLHLGNARSFLLAWLDIRSRGGRIVMRMEDLDGPRTRPEAAAQALADLAWLGLDWDEGPDVGGDHGPYVQTERLTFYQEALQELDQARRIYPCVCTRKEVAAAASAPHDLPGHEGPRYPGTCRNRFPDLGAAKLSGRPAAIRIRVAEEAELLVDDRFHGTFSSPVGRQVGDFVVAKGDGTPAYQLACVVDDHAMGITDVLRGDDLLPSTGRQLHLFAALGWPAPRYAHLPLLVGEDGRRLAKRHGDTTVRRFREAGIAPQALVGWLGEISGLLPEGGLASPADLLPGFSLSRIPAAPIVVKLPLPFAPNVST